MAGRGLRASRPQSYFQPKPLSQFGMHTKLHFMFAHHSRPSVGFVDLHLSLQCHARPTTVIIKAPFTKLAYSMLGLGLDVFTFEGSHSGLHNSKRRCDYVIALCQTTTSTFTGLHQAYLSTHKLDALLVIDLHVNWISSPGCVQNVSHQMVHGSVPCCFFTLLHMHHVISTQQLTRVDGIMYQR